MPNHCHNTLKVTHKDPELINKFYYDNTFEDDEEELSFNYLIPEPEGWSDECLYDWSIKNWGTKWDCWETDVEKKKNELIYTFTTAWNPPVYWFDKLVTKYPDYYIKLEYEDPYVCLLGYYEFKKGELNRSMVCNEIIE